MAASGIFFGFYCFFISYFPQTTSRLFPHTQKYLLVCVHQAKLKVYMDKDEMTIASLKSASKAALGIGKWMKAILNFARVFKDVAPKKAALAKAQVTQNSARMSSGKVPIRCKPLIRIISPEDKSDRALAIFSFCFLQDK